MRIFLSYRRSDVGGHAGRLFDALAARLGPKNVFQDVTAIHAGQDFTAAIQDAIGDCDAALVVIGPGWVTASTPEGGLRLLEPDDYVRLELATVLQRELPVAPVLVRGASMPSPAELPEDLRPLLRRQAITVRDESWHQDVENLLRSLRGDLVTPGRTDRRRPVVTVAAVALLAIVGIILWRPWAGGSGVMGARNRRTYPHARTPPTPAETRSRSLPTIRGGCSGRAASWSLPYGEQAGDRSNPVDGS